MSSTAYRILILFGLVTNLQCVPTIKSLDDPRSDNVRNPEHNDGFEGGDMVPRPVVSTLTDRGVAIKPATNNRWAGGVVPYVFASNITTTDANFIVTQMRAMENLTQVNNRSCISFRPRTASDLYYITIFNGSGCYAPVGSWGTYTGVRPVSFMHGTYSTCMVSGIIQHELTHVLGFYHEQSRPDRDSYVSIQWANIVPNQAFNFDKMNDTDVDTLMTSYDYGSVMHYEWNAFALNSSGATIVPLQNTSAFIGQRVRLSPVDILEIQRYYGCVSAPDQTITSTVTTTTTTSTTARNLTSFLTTQTVTNSTMATNTFTDRVTTQSTRAPSRENSSVVSQSSTQTTATVSNALKIGLGVGITCFFIFIVVGCVIACIAFRRCRK